MRQKEDVFQLNSLNLLIDKFDSFILTSHQQKKLRKSKFYNKTLTFDWGILTWPNQDDSMNTTKSRQQQTLTIEHDSDKP